ncbi:hypothetical protein [Oscillibacter sp.]|uniref:hypothetical protein n=1 Tax=Oscillibacter sp. TaxID=1945593 RepID=UPI002629DDCC|nr:hypothetical protein [Oscillibacter sp.]MDD3346829.1 hypothetical protein [Oscillibacter sp.]
MEAKLNEYLREGEHIRWQSKPENFQLLESSSKTQILRKWVLTLAICGGLIISYLSAHERSNSLGFVSLMTFCAAVMLISPMMEKRGLMKSRYWITDRRVIQMTKDKVFYYMNLSDVDKYEIVKGLTDNDCLVVGSPVFADVEKHIRWRASHPKEDPEALKDRDHVDGMILYNIGNAAAGAALLKELGRTKAA